MVGGFSLVVGLLCGASISGVSADAETCMTGEITLRRVLVPEQKHTFAFGVAQLGPQGANPDAWQYGVLLEPGTVLTVWEEGKCILVDQTETEGPASSPPKSSV